MIIGAIKIETTEKGIAVEQVALSDQELASPEERAVAGVLDAALKTALEFVGVTCGQARMIEGKDIEEHVAAILRREHATPFREQLRRAGIEIPPQR